MDKFVYIKTLEKPLDKSGKPYTKITDQDLQVWSIFRNDTAFEVGKSYLFSYNLNDKGYPDIQKITPLVNIFQQKALRDVANINDIKRDVGISTSYAVQLCVGGKISLNELFTWADRIHDYTQNKAISLMPKDEK